MPWSLPPSFPETASFPEVPGLWEDITDGFGHRTYDKLNETDLVAPTRTSRRHTTGDLAKKTFLCSGGSDEDHHQLIGVHMANIRSQTLGENITGITKAPPPAAPASWAYSPSLGRSTLAPGCLALSPHRPVRTRYDALGRTLNGTTGRCGDPDHHQVACAKNSSRHRCANS